MLVTLEEAVKLIKSGKILHIAADESLLEKLPKGAWIGGTTPYFITDKGGILTKDKLFVSEIAAENCKTAVYDEDHLFDLTRDAYSNGICFLILPFGSTATARYAKEAPSSADLLMVPTVGWVSGFDLSSGGSAKVYDGITGASYTDKAVALHVSLPAGKIASIGIINIFEEDKSGPQITFEEDTMSIKYCSVGAKKQLFADYLAENSINTQLPLVSDYNGTLINVSIKAVADDKTVELYAPVFAGNTYRFAKVIEDYSAAFSGKLRGFNATKPVFSCNCILNYLYGNLEGKSTPPFAGPVTFGEIAYHLLNQTLVYVEVISE